MSQGNIETQPDVPKKKDPDPNPTTVGTGTPTTGPDTTLEVVQDGQKSKKEGVDKTAIDQKKKGQPETQEKDKDQKKKEKDPNDWIEKLEKDMRRILETDKIAAAQWEEVKSFLKDPVETVQRWGTSAKEKIDYMKERIVDFLELEDTAKKPSSLSTPQTNGVDPIKKVQTESDGLDEGEKVVGKGVEETPELQDNQTPTQGL